ncbi:MAG: hypothetical protein QGI63_04780 [Rhodospirillales bacterium]|jgi:hypothetical protein|nr:hypothetical protein [Rhodospirillales bacterium]MDP6773565.1 hypothetical protein [Rhodospirillales bacterium]
MNETSVVGSTQLALLPAGTEEGASPSGDGGFQPFGDDGFTFFDFLDIINPLQHIPVVSTIYRDLTGDTLDHGSRFAGSTLFGGPIGALASVVNIIFEETTGKDVGEHVMAFFTDDGADDDGTATAEAVPEADFETGAGGTLAEPDIVNPWTSPLPAPVKELALAPLAQDTATDAPQPVSSPIHAQRALLPSNRSFLSEGAIGEPAAPGGSTILPSPSSAPLAAAAASNPVTTPSDTMAALLRESEKEADAFAAIQQRVASATPESPKATHAEAGEGARPPAGALAPQGGWFSEVMLSALAKYQGSAELARMTPPTVSLTN